MRNFVAVNYLDPLSDKNIANCFTVSRESSLSEPLRRHRGRRDCLPRIRGNSSHRRGRKRKASMADDFSYSLKFSLLPGQYNTGDRDNTLPVSVARVRGGYLWEHSGESPMFEAWVYQAKFVED